MYNLVPQFPRVNFLGVFRIVRVDRILLDKRFVFHHSLHKVVGDTHGYVSVGDFPLGHLRIDKRLRIRVFNTDTHHQCATSAVLCHFFCGVGVAFHEGNHACRCQSAVFHRASGRTNMRQVVTNATTSFHELHLLLVNLHDAAV